MHLDSSGRAVPKARLAETITAYLIERIGAKVLRPGDALPSESDLAAQFSVSKPVVREALKALAARGLVDIRQGRATTVQALSSAPLNAFFGVAIRASDNGLREALELRRAIETETAALAAERATSTHVAALEEIVVRMRRDLKRLDAWLAADYAFHMLLVRCADNGLLVYLTEALGDVMKQSMQLLGSQTDLRDPKATLQRHECIFEATHPVVLAIAQDRRRRERPGRRS